MGFFSPRKHANPRVQGFEAVSFSSRFMQLHVGNFCCWFQIVHHSRGGGALEAICAVNVKKAGDRPWRKRSRARGGAKRPPRTPPVGRQAVKKAFPDHEESVDVQQQFPLRGPDGPCGATSLCGIFSPRKHANPRVQGYSRFSQLRVVTRFCCWFPILFTTPVGGEPSKRSAQ